MQEPDIHCPHCAWRPPGRSRWWCAPRTGGCSTLWNTFWTGGVCPGCAYRWEITACLACKRFAPHRDWYHWPEPASEAREAEREGTA
ncbi:hypothetical protein [Frateuria defendens]|uniref:hypothetical protein n=1 Tax=Frateuria defendens TaxID=2219559 RepID=UPI00066FDA54|nr:hypothetical protein [Frateuria defendens]